MHQPGHEPGSSRERFWILFLGLVAIVHVFIYSAAFPFSNNVDEQAHLDLILKYSKGHLPRTLEKFSKESSQYLAVYSTREYLGLPDYFPNGIFPQPLWKKPFEQVRDFILKEQEIWLTSQNHESSQPPLYYALVGTWYWLGKGLGFDGAGLLYWLRFANCAFIMALVWISYRAARWIFPQSEFGRLAVPALVAFLPQTTFYSLQNDVLSPITAGLLLMAFIYFFQSNFKDLRLAFWTGLAFAGTFLTKSSNLPILFTILLVAAAGFFREAKINGWKVLIRPGLTFALTAALPSLAWMIWMKLTFGDFGGTHLKMQRLDWTYKPFTEWFHHPIFMPKGFYIFFTELMDSFWQGEFWWHRKPMTVPIIGKCYLFVSVLLVTTALIKARNAEEKGQASKLYFCFSCFTASVLFYALLSVMFDFGNCPNPSREHPYFVSGRLMSGALIPFLLLFVYGLNSLLPRNDRLKWFALGGFLLFMSISEIATNWPAFFSEFNWYHL